MKYDSHSRARQMLHTGIENLSTKEQADIAEHLAICMECRDYAQDLAALQSALAKAMHDRWGSQSFIRKSGYSIQQRWMKVRLKQRAVRLITIMSAIITVALLVAYKPSLLLSLLPVPVLPATPVATEVSPPQFNIAYTAYPSTSASRETRLIDPDLEGQKIIQVPSVIEVSSPPVWSWNGSRIAFMDCDKNIYLSGPDGTDPVSLEGILSRNNVLPLCSTLMSWSPDSTRIAFQGKSTLFPFYKDVFIVSAAGDTLDNITQNIWSSDQERVITEVTSLRWSPDGQKLAIATNRDIYTAAINGANARKITDQKQQAAFLNWSPDSKHIIYAAIRNDLSEITRVSVDGDDVKILGEGHEPDLSPDGRQVVFTGDNGGIFIMDIDGKNVRQIVNTFSVSPHWSPDGKTIAYLDPIVSADQYMGNSLWIVTKDGGEGKKLVEPVEQILMWIRWTGGS